MLQALSDQAEPVTIAALVTLTHLHENTLRGHLDGLVRAGLVRRHRADRAGRGRPAWLYQRIETQPSEAIEYAGLAATLARTIVELSGDPVADAARSGLDWGRRLARDRGAVDLPSEEARAQLVDLMDDLGFAPRQKEQDPSQVRLTRCPLLEAAYRQPEVVCAVHLGLARGALQEYGADPTGTELVPFSEPGACLLLLLLADL